MRPTGRPIQERLAEFYRRLVAAPPARSADEGMALISSVLRDVEDEMSGIPEKIPPPNLGESDGRMYPPMSDRITRYPDGSLTARTRRHIISVSVDGAITIRRADTGQIGLDIPGGQAGG